MKCLNPNCQHEGVTRGLCKYCYSACAIVVKMGAITWGEIVAKGLATDPKPRGRIRQLRDAVLKRLQYEKYPNGVPTREAFIELIGGDLRVLSPKHLDLFNSIWPENAPPRCFVSTVFRAPSPQPTASIASFITEPPRSESEAAAAPQS